MKRTLGDRLTKARAIFGLFAVGISLIFAGNLDRGLWMLSSQGQELPGQVVDIRSIIVSDKSLIFQPRVAFKDPSGLPREMNVSRGSSKYDFRLADRVTILWDAGTQSFAIKLPFQRHPIMNILLWAITGLGGILVLIATWGCWRRWRIWRRG